MEVPERFPVRFKDFVGAWIPGSPLKSRPETDSDCRYETPDPVISFPSRSTVDVPVNLDDSDQDRDQGVRSQGQDDGAGDVLDREEGPGEVCCHEDPAERPVRQRKPNVRYSAYMYNLRFIWSRSRRTIRRAM